MNKCLKAILLLLGISISIFIAVNWKSLKFFPWVLPSYYAKEFCTCRYVLENDNEFCHQLVRQYIPIQTIIIDDSRRHVEVKALWHYRGAQWISPTEGCQLEELKN